MVRGGGVMELHCLDSVAPRVWRVNRTHPHGANPGKRGPPVYVIEDILLAHQHGL